MDDTQTNTAATDTSLNPVMLAATSSPNVGASSNDLASNNTAADSLAAVATTTSDTARVDDSEQLALLRKIDAKIDAMATRAARQGAIAGSVAGGISGGIVAVGVQFIRHKLGF